MSDTSQAGVVGESGPTPNQQYHQITKYRVYQNHPAYFAYNHQTSILINETISQFIDMLNSKSKKHDPELAFTEVTHIVDNPTLLEKLQFHIEGLELYGGDYEVRFGDSPESKVLKERLAGNRIAIDAILNESLPEIIQTYIPTFVINRYPSEQASSLLDTFVSVLCGSETALDPLGKTTDIDFRDTTQRN